MYYIYTEGKNDFESEFPQIGIKIRNLTDDEKKKIGNRYKEIYNNRIKFHSMLRLFEIDRALFRKLEFVFRYEELNELFIREFRLYKKKPIFHVNISNLLEKIMVIEVQENKIEKYIESEEIEMFIKRFLKLAHIYDKKDDVEDLSYNNRSHFGRCNLSPIDEIIIKHLYNDFSNTSHYVIKGANCLFEYCITMKCFFENLNSTDVFRFVEILEMYNLKYDYRQNLVVNNVLVMESLVIKEDSQTIARDFTLKLSLLISESSHEYELEDYAFIFDYLYSVRSDIVHGNTEKLLNDYSKLKSKLPGLDYPSIGNVSKMKRKRMIIAFSYIISKEILDTILKVWFSNPSKLNFIKNS